MAVGAHEIEFDLWPSRDGVLAVCHDETVDRTTNGAGKIAELTWKEICSLDAGARAVRRTSTPGGRYGIGRGVHLSTILT